MLVISKAVDVEVETELDTLVLDVVAKLVLKIVVVLDAVIVPETEVEMVVVGDGMTVVETVKPEMTLVLRVEVTSVVSIVEVAVLVMTD